MVNFPTIRNPKYDGIDERIIKKQVRNETEGGYTISRCRSLRSKLSWGLSWSEMPELDYQTLKTFFETYQGTIFTWTHPISLVAYSVRFVGDEVASNVPYNGSRSVQIQLEEV
jgi:hypothetical protein